MSGAGSNNRGFEYIVDQKPGMSQQQQHLMNRQNDSIISALSRPAGNQRLGNQMQDIKPVTIKLESGNHHVDFNGGRTGYSSNSVEMNSFVSQQSNSNGNNNKYIYVQPSPGGSLPVGGTQLGSGEKYVILNHTGGSNLKLQNKRPLTPAMTMSRSSPSYTAGSPINRPPSAPSNSARQINSIRTSDGLVQGSSSVQFRPILSGGNQGSRTSFGNQGGGNVALVLQGGSGSQQGQLIAGSSNNLTAVNIGPAGNKLITSGISNANVPSTSTVTIFATTANSTTNVSSQQHQNGPIHINGRPMVSTSGQPVSSASNFSANISGASNSWNGTPSSSVSNGPTRALSQPGIQSQVGGGRGPGGGPPPRGRAPGNPLSADQTLAKCTNFFNTLISLAKRQQNGDHSAAARVEGLVQEVVYGQISPEQFTQGIQAALKSAAQPNLMPFLQRALPPLRMALARGEVSIDGIQPPSLSSVSTQLTGDNSGRITVRTAPNPQHGNSSDASTNSGGFNARILSSQQQHPVSFQPVQTSGPRLLTTSSMGPPPVPGPRNSGMPGGSGPRLQQPARLIVNQQPSGFVARSGSSFGSQPQTTVQQFVVATPSSTPQGLSHGGLVRKPMLSRPTPSKNQVSNFMSANAKTGGSPAPASASDKYKEEADDLNDVAAMGGVNLLEETKNILASTGQLLASETRTGASRDILEGLGRFISLPAIRQRLLDRASKAGISLDLQPDSAELAALAVNQKLRDYLSRLSVLAEHRLENLRVNSWYQQTSDSKPQLKFLDELDEIDHQKKEDREKELLIKMSKSRTKGMEDSEAERLKQKAKELQKAQEEEQRNSRANEAAAMALGKSRKRPWAAPDSEVTYDGPFAQPLAPVGGGPSGLRQPNAGRPKIKRVNMKDLQVLLLSEKETRQSSFLYKCFLSSSTLSGPANQGGPGGTSNSKS